jgi:hypothetical protein
MPPTVAVAVRYPHPHALADSWDVLDGTLVLPADAPPPGASVLVDGRVGDVGFLLGGQVVPGPEGTRRVEVAPEGRPLIEALLEPGRDAVRRAVA